jgi:hypothetical protein
MYQVLSTFKIRIAVGRLEARGKKQESRLHSFAACLPTGRLGVFARENQGIPPAPLAIQDAGTLAIHHFFPINYFWTSILFLNENNQLVIN